MGAPSRRTAAAAVALVLAVVGAACGDDDAAEQPTTTRARRVEVFFGAPGEDQDCSAVAPVPRDVSENDTLRETLDALLEGPTKGESDAGYTSWFSPATTGMLRSVTIEEDTARVEFADFRSIIPNASTSCGSAALLAQLDSTVMQFPGIERAVYSFDGDVDSFYEWLQLGPPEGYGSARE